MLYKEKEILEKMKEELLYDKKTGIFIRRKGKNGAKRGKIAGSIYNNGYRVVRINGIKFGAHRLARLYVYGHFPKQQIDHINHIRDDNRIINLRDVSKAENCRNNTKNRRNSSGTTGVVWDKCGKNWRVNIGRGSGKSSYYGSSKSKIEAIKLRRKAEKEYGYSETHGKIDTIY